MLHILLPMAGNPAVKIGEVKIEGMEIKLNYTNLK